MRAERIWRWVRNAPDRREHPRFEVPKLVLRIEDHKYQPTDWSLGGFRIRRFHRQLKPRERLQGCIVVLEGRGGMSSFEAEVTRVSEDGEICCRWIEVTNVTFEALAELRPI